MAKLTITDDEGRSIPVALVRDVYEVGRDEANVIRLTERNISRKHAELRKRDGAWLLVDLGSYNGCWVNGERVSGEQPLTSGDVIQLGDYRASFEGDGAAASAPPPAPEPSVGGARSVPATVRSLPRDEEETPAPPSRRTASRPPNGSVPPVRDTWTKSAPPAAPAVEPASDPQIPVAHETDDGPDPFAPPPRRVPVPLVALLAAGAGALAVLMLRPAEAPAPTAVAPPTQAAQAPSAVAAQQPTATPPPAAAPSTVAAAPDVPAPAAPPARTTAPAAARTTGATRAADPPAPPQPPATTPPAAATPPKPAAPTESPRELALAGRDAEAKAALAPRVFSGRGSPDEVRLLKAICKRLGDQACVQRVSQLLATN